LKYRQTKKNNQAAGRNAISMGAGWQFQIKIMIQSKESACESEQLLLFDGACPICDFYVHRILKPASSARLEALDLRRVENAEFVRSINVDPEVGFVLLTSCGVKHGPECIGALAKGTSGIVGMAHAVIGKSSAVAALVYCTFRLLRRASLWSLGVAPLQGLAKITSHTVNRGSDD
jgi:hypothetical protein